MKPFPANRAAAFCKSYRKVIRGDQVNDPRLVTRLHTPYIIPAFAVYWDRLIGCRVCRHLNRCPLWACAPSGLIEIEIVDPVVTLLIK